MPRAKPKRVVTEAVRPNDLISLLTEWRDRAEEWEEYNAKMVEEINRITGGKKWATSYAASVRAPEPVKTVTVPELSLRERRLTSAAVSGGMGPVSVPCAEAREE